MGKEFKKKFMHPTRRKLVDMVQTGKYDKKTTVGYTKAKETHNVGDKWEDETHKYEKKEGYTIKTGKNSETFQAIRKYLSKLNTCNNKECPNVGNYTSNHLKSIKQFGYCIDCMSKLELDLKEHGLLESFAAYHIYTNRIKEGRMVIDRIEADISELKQQYDEIDDKGKVVNSYVLPRPVEEMKQEMRDFVVRSKKEIEEIVEAREEHFTKLKEKNYEHYI